MGRKALIVAAVTGLGLLISGSPVSAVVVPPVTTATVVSANPADQTPHAKDGETWAFAQIGNTVYVGGSFTTVKEAGSSTWITRRFLFAYDRSSGAISSTFVPTVDNTVHTLAVSPDGQLLVGGAFQNVNGVSRRNMVELDPTTGATVAGWVGKSDGGTVRAMVVRGNQLYVGGAFQWVNGTFHSLLARLNATTGAIDSTFQINASVPRTSSMLVWTLDVTPDGGTLVAGGNFTQVNGLTRNQIVMVDTTGTPAVADWSTEHYVHPCYSGSFPFYVKDVDFSDDGSYFVVGANGGSGSGAYCDAVARFETATRGSAIDGTWVDYTGTDSVTSVEAADGVVYAAGHFRWLNNANASDAPGPGAIDRLGIGALDPSNGMPINWNPRRSAGSNLPAGATAWGANVGVLWRGTDGVYFGHNSDGMGNEYHGRFGMFPLSGGRTVTAQDAPQTTPGYLYLGAGDGQLTKVPFNGTTLGVATVSSQPNLASAGAAFAVSNNKVYWAKTDPSAPNGSYLELSYFNGTIQAPWINSYNSWFHAADMYGAFMLSGRMYYTKNGSDTLFYRYLEPDSYFVGCTEFSLPTVNLAWGAVRGMTWVAGSIVYGSTDGSLRKVAFDPTAAGGNAVDGASATLIAASAPGLDWSSRTLFYATI